MNFQIHSFFFRFRKKKHLIKIKEFVLYFFFHIFVSCQIKIVHVLQQNSNGQSISLYPQNDLILEIV